MRSSINENMELPQFCGYQLFGDSNMVRFCTNILNLKSTRNQFGSAQIGCSVSGQMLQDLTIRMEHYKEIIGNKVLISIGTNDVKNLTSFENFKTQLQNLMELLKDKEVVFLTIAPLVFYWDDTNRIVKTDRFNNEIKKLEGDSCRVLDLHKFMLGEDGMPRKERYEKFYTMPQDRRNLPQRVDLIHFNSIGLEDIAYWLADHLNAFIYNIKCNE